MKINNLKWNLQTKHYNSLKGLQDTSFALRCLCCHCLLRACNCCIRLPARFTQKLMDYLHCVYNYEVIHGTICSCLKPIVLVILWSHLIAMLVWDEMDQKPSDAANTHICGSSCMDIHTCGCMSMVLSMHHVRILACGGGITVSSALNVLLLVTRREKLTLCTYVLIRISKHATYIYNVHTYLSIHAYRGFKIRHLCCDLCLAPPSSGFQNSNTKFFTTRISIANIYEYRYKY